MVWVTSCACSQARGDAIIRDLCCAGLGAHASCLAPFLQLSPASFPTHGSSPCSSAGNVLNKAMFVCSPGSPGSIGLAPPPLGPGMSAVWSRGPAHRHTGTASRRELPLAGNNRRTCRHRLWRRPSPHCSLALAVSNVSVFLILHTAQRSLMPADTPPH